MKTRTDRSLLLMIPMVPVKKVDMPEIPAINIGIVRKRLLKNVAPPCCPEATRRWNNMNNKMKAAISQIDHWPKRVFGIK